MIASGWGGWGTGRQDGPYWGTIGQSVDWESTGKGLRNFKITSKYIGIIPFLFGIYGVVMALRQRKAEEGRLMLFWSMAGILGFWLAFGKYSLLYTFFYQLPLVGNIRDQSKFLDLFQVCLGIVSAYGLDQLIQKGRDKSVSKVFWIVSASFAGVMLLAGLNYWIAPAGRIAEFNSMGFSGYATTMVKNMGNAWVHAAALSLICSVLAFVVWKGFKQAKWVPAVFVMVLAIDSLILTSHYFKATNISTLKKGNVLINYLKENQANERTFFVDQSGIYNQWLASDGPYHDLNLFNIWQMPRMPVAYKEYLGKVGRNQIRLWELSAIKYVAAPASIMQQLQQNPELGKMFKPVLNYQVPTTQGMRPDVLLEFKGAIPRFALFQGWTTAPLEKHCDILVSQQHDPKTTLLVNSASGITAQMDASGFQSLEGEVTKKTAVINVTTDRPAILRFSQRFQPGWTVFVDGNRAELLTVDYLCMGVALPPGSHQVEFRCINGTPTVAFMGAVFVLSLVSGLALLIGRKGPPSE